MRTVIAGRREEKNEAIARRLQQEHGTDTLAVTTDVSREQDCEQLVRTAIEKFGRLDLLVNNAGIGAHNTIAHTASDEFDRVLRTNWCCRDGARMDKEAR